MNIESVSVLGIRIDDVTTQETLRIIEEFVAEKKPHQIVTVNPEFVIEAQHNGGFRLVLDKAALSLPDGSGLLWASRLLRRPLRERVTGADTLPLIAKMSAARGYRLYLLGAAPGVAEKAAAILTHDYPGLKVVGCYAGSPDPAEEEGIMARVKAASPDMLFVAYGAPCQDVWIHRHLERLGVPVCIGVGGAFDFIAGVARRAPLWMRKLGVEWLYRLWYQPWRWRRMLALPRFVYLVVRERLLSGTRRN